MGEHLRIGKFRISGPLIRVVGEPTTDEGKITGAYAIGKVMVFMAPIHVIYDSGRDDYVFYAYSTLFDDVLICEGQEPPEYRIKITADGNSDECLVEAERLDD